MKITHIIETRKEDWNSLVSRTRSFVLMQTWEWGKFKEELGWEPFRIAVEDDGELVAGAQILFKSMSMGLIKMAYVPRGPVGEWSHPDVAALLLDEMHRIARGNRAAFLRIEPPLEDSSPNISVLEEKGFRQSSYSNQPRATIIVDLSLDMDNLMSRFSQKTRYNIRYAERKGVEVRIGNEKDIPIFYKLMQTTAKRAGFANRSLEYYTKEWNTLSKKGVVKLFIAEFRGQPIAANMSAAFGECGAFLHGASSGEHTNLQPNYLLMWKAMEWAHNKSCSIFDLWGIPDEVGISVVRQGADLPINHRTDGLWGTYHFKRGFSKDVKLYCCAHDYAYSPFIYNLSVNTYFDTNSFEHIVAFFDRFK